MVSYFYQLSWAIVYSYLAKCSRWLRKDALDEMNSRLGETAGGRPPPIRWKPYWKSPTSISKTLGAARLQIWTSGSLPSLQLNSILQVWNLPGSKAVCDCTCTCSFSAYFSCVHKHTLENQKFYWFSPKLNLSFFNFINDNRNLLKLKEEGVY